MGQKDEYPIGGGSCQKRGGLGKRDRSESQQKMNIQQEVGHVKKGRIRNINS